jgi:integrase/recombinase XerD
LKLNQCIALFLTRYLSDIRGADPDTVRCYKDAFRVFAPFAARRLSKKSALIDVGDLAPDLIIDFLVHLETGLGNSIRTRNLRLSAIRSMARMIRLMVPEDRDIADRILDIPYKRTPKPLFGYLTHDEILKVFASVNLKRKEGFRDYAMLHLLFDSGARAHEIAQMKVEHFEAAEMRIGILGKGGRFRIVQLWPRTTDLIRLYIGHHRETPATGYRDRLFINQRREGFTRHGIYRICDKHLKKVLPESRLKNLHSAHCFRHSCAIHMLMEGKPVSDIKTHLGHEDISSTMIYLRLDLSKRREIQKRFIEYTKKVIKKDQELDEFFKGEDMEEILEWLDGLKDGDAKSDPRKKR